MQITQTINVSPATNPAEIHRWIELGAKLDEENWTRLKTNGELTHSTADNEPKAEPVAAAKIEPTPAAPVAAPRRSGGRRAAASAEEQANAVQDAADQSPPAGTAPAIPPGMGLPPGVTQRVEPAMPRTEPNGTGEDGHPTLEDVRACLLQANAKDPKLAFRIMKAKAWPSGDAKESWYTIEAVPAELRDRLIDEISAQLAT